MDYHMSRTVSGTFDEVTGCKRKELSNEGFGQDCCGAETLPGLAHRLASNVGGRSNRIN